MIPRHDEGQDEKARKKMGNRYRKKTYDLQAYIASSPPANEYPS
jgi:hypothetical protein